LFSTYRKIVLKITIADRTSNCNDVYQSPINRTNWYDISEIQLGTLFPIYRAKPTYTITKKIWSFIRRLIPPSRRCDRGRKLFAAVRRERKFNRRTKLRRWNSAMVWGLVFKVAVDFHRRQLYECGASRCFRFLPQSRVRRTL